MKKWLNLLMLILTLLMCINTDAYYAESPPSSVSWGTVYEGGSYNNAGKFGIDYTQNNSSTSSTIDADFWFRTRYRVNDIYNNTVVGWSSGKVTNGVNFEMPIEKYMYNAAESSEGKSEWLDIMCFKVESDSETFARGSSDYIGDVQGSINTVEGLGGVSGYFSGDYTVGVKHKVSFVIPSGHTHSYTTWGDEMQPRNCTQAGWYKKKCSGCDSQVFNWSDSQYKRYDALGHTTEGSWWDYSDDYGWGRSTHRYQKCGRGCGHTLSTQYAVYVDAGTGIKSAGNTNWYNPGSTVQYWAEVDTGYAWGSWSDGGTQQSGSTVINSPQWWTANAVLCTYNLVYDKNAPNQGTTTGSVESQVCKYSETYKYRNYGFSNTYYYQTGWNVLSNHKNAGDSFSNLTSTNNATVTATAEWTPKPYTIVYKKGSSVATGADVNQNVTTAQQVTLNNGSTFSRDGYKIIGWSYTEGATEPDFDLSAVREAFTGALTTTKDATVTLYAVWQPREYTVRYKANGGTGEDVVETWVYEQPHTLYNNYTNKHFTKTGYYVNRYIFKDITNIIESVKNKPLNAGGDYNESYTVVTTNQAIGDLIVPTRDGMEVVLNCNWAPIRYKVQYNNDSAERLIATNNNERGYKVSTDVYTTPTYSFGTKYDLEWYNFTRQNKYGKSTFLGYGLIDQDKSLKPEWSVVGRTPASITGTSTQLTASDFNGQETKEGTSYDTYFAYLNSGSPQTFNIYAVWDDCPGIEPVDIYASMIGGDSTISRAKMPNNQVRSGMQIEYDLLFHPQNLNSVWDREGNNKSAGALDKTHYYISYLNVADMASQKNVTTYEVKYTIEDSNGNKYTASRKLYSGVLADIMISN